MTEVSKEEIERRAMEAVRRLLTTPKAGKTSAGRSAAKRAAADETKSKPALLPARHKP